MGAVYADIAWCSETGDDNIYIGVIDSSVDYSHVELNGVVEYGWNFTDGNNDILPSYAAGQEAQILILCYRNNFRF